MIFNTRRYPLIVFVLLMLALIYAMAALLPSALSMQYSGMQIVDTRGEWLVQDIHKNSPSLKSGVARGDRIISIEGRDVGTWHALYQNKLTQYVQLRSAWSGRLIGLTVEREDVQLNLNIQLRSLSASEVMKFYGIPLVLIIFLTILVIFIITASPKDNRAFVVAISFCILIAWVGSDTPNWPEFLSPLIPDDSLSEFLVRDFGFTFFSQILLSLVIHILLIVPSPWMPTKVIARLLPWVYIVPTGTALIFITVVLPEPSVDHLVASYNFRLWIDTILLILIPMLMVISYRKQQSPVQKEQSRWLIRAVFTVMLIHLALWNIPKVFLGTPLVDYYGWIWLSVMLVPLALTFAIANNRIFGIRGLIRRRIEILDNQLDREHHMLKRRDDRIKDLVNEIQHLSNELKTYEAAEKTCAPIIIKTDKLQRLEADYPVIREVRASELLGASPKWEKVYQEAILAAFGDTPVVIVGESGTGKTALAHTIFSLSKHVEGPYRQISCSQFEHSDPAFALGKLFGIGTSHGLPNVPREGQRGILEECDDGALFLDDIDRLPLNVQDLLLYPLEGKAFEPGIGTGTPRKVSIKYILATNREPEALVQQGRLQADVLARMGARVFIPPLRERPEDIPHLARHFLKQLALEFEHEVDTISPKAMILLVQYRYEQGNVRELNAELRKAVGIASLEKDRVLRAGYLSEALREQISPAARVTKDASSKTALRNSEPMESGAISRELQILRKHDFVIKPSETDLQFSHKSKTLTHYVRGLCLKSLRENNWDTAIAARALVGENKPKVEAKLARRISRLLVTISTRVAEGAEARLYTNLPAAYHTALDEAINRAKR